MTTEVSYKKAIEELHNFMIEVENHLPKKAKDRKERYFYDFSKSQIAIFEHVRNVFYDICQENGLPYSRAK